MKTMKHIKTLFTALLLTLLALPSLARQDAALPDLAPREVEITGDLSISFPALRRQPIVGFNPPPRVPDIPGNRQPFTEAYAQRSADLPPSPLQPPEPPQVSAIERRIAAEGLIAARLGAYLDRSLKADVTMLQTESTTALLDIDYFGTDGQDLVVSGTNVTTGRDAFSAGVDLEHRTGPMVLGIGGSGFRSSYGLFGAIPGAASPASADPGRVVSGFEGSLSTGTRSGSRNRLSLETTVGITNVDSDLFDPAVRIDPATEREAGYVELDLDTAFPIRDGEIRINADGSSMGLDSASFPGSTVRSGIASAEFAWQYSAKLFISAGAAYLGFNSDSQTGIDPNRSLSYVAPIAGVEYLVSEAISVKAVARPVMTSGLLKDVLSDSPIVMDEPIVLPSIATLDARLGLHIQSELFTASIAGGWRDQPFRRIAYDLAGSNRGYASGYPALDYRSADVIFSSVDASIIPFRGLQIGVDALWQQTTLAATSEQAPYVSPLVFGGFIALSMMNGDLESRLEVVHEASRQSDLAGTTDIPSFTSVNAMISWFFHQNYGLTSGVRDLGSDPQYWRGYAYESNVFFLGFRYRW
jgi:hypothetical protein